MAQSRFELNQPSGRGSTRAVHSATRDLSGKLFRPAAVEYREALVSFFYVVPLELAAISRPVRMPLEHLHGTI
jgi:hypothetical protein